MLPSTVPLDESSQGIQTLIARHVLTVPLEQQVWQRRGNDSVCLGGRLIQYAGIYPKRLWHFEAAQPVAPTQFQVAVVLSDGHLQQDVRYRAIILFDQYDAWGNLLQQRHAQAPPVAYLWGYSNTLPIAEIKNVSYTQVQQKLQGLGIQVSSLKTDAQVREAMQRLRKSLPGTQMNSYTYRPLIGPLSQTDLSGRTTFFEYDSLGRLIRTRDEQGHILSQQQYHYAGQ